MSAPASRWKLGLFVVTAGTAGLAALTYVGAQELKRSARTAYAYFDEALTGLEEGSPVKFRGVTIGVVDRIRVAPDKKHLEVQASLYDDYLRDLGLDVSRFEGDCPLPENLRAQVVMSWVTGTAFVQVDFLPDPPRGPQLLPFELPPGRHTLRTVPSTAKSLEVAAREVLRELPAMASSARELVELLRTELAAARLPELSKRLQDVLGEVDAQLADVRRLGILPSAGQALESGRDLLQRLAADDAPLATALTEWRELGASLRREIEAARLGDTAAEVRGAASNFAGLGPDLQRELLHFHAALAAIERLATLLEREPGALLHGRSAPRSPLEGNR